MNSSTVEYSAGTVPALLLFTLDTSLARVYRHFAPDPMARPASSRRPVLYSLLV